MDGTLIDTEPYWMAAEYELVEAHGGTWTEQQARTLVGFDLIDAARVIAEQGPVPLTPERIVAELLARVTARLEREIPWRPGARTLLNELRTSGIDCALVTMSWRSAVEPMLAHLPPGTFAAVVCGDEVPEGKPSPVPYLRAAELLGVPADDCVAIEDSPTGVASAVAAGCRVLGVPNVREVDPQPGVTVRETLRGVGVDDLSQLPNRAEALERRRRNRLLGGLAAIAIALVAFAVFSLRPAPDPPLIPMDTWAPYWTLDRTNTEFSGRVDSLREVSPFWYRVDDPNEITADPNAPVAATEEFIERVRRSNATIIPSVMDYLPAGGMAAVLADPVTRRAHIDALVDFVVDGGFDGVDLDYEQFAFADDRSTWETTSVHWIEFLTELSTELRARDLTLTVSVPPIYDAERTADSGYWVYDYAAMADVVDNIRIMAYDFSTATAGPIAPLEFVQRAVDGATAAVSDRSRLVLGIPVYGYNWPVTAVGTCPDDAPRRTTVTTRSVHDLLERRGGEPVRNDTTGEWTFNYELVVEDDETSCVQQREVHYVDGDGAVERIEIARRAGFGGVALWALGYEDDPVWDAIADVIRLPDDPADEDKDEDTS